MVWCDNIIYKSMSIPTSLPGVGAPNRRQQEAPLLEEVGLSSLFSRLELNDLGQTVKM